MREDRTSGRELKRIVARALGSSNWQQELGSVCSLPARQVVNPLFALFCDRDPLMRWRAVTAMGAVVAGLAEENLESARVVMRRFMWNLNEESGGIGWGCPEAMGECMARSRRLADEYGCILISYLHPGRNFIEHPALQEGVLWGFGRLAHAHSATTADCGEILLPFLTCAASALRGLSAWASAPLADARLMPPLENLTADPASFMLYREDRLESCSVGELAREALQQMRRET
jgi:hypothetical protein